MNNSELLRECIKEVTVKFTEKNYRSFLHSDYVLLSDKIFETTKVSISVSTLKRIWKKDYIGTPNISTLDAFAQYLNYENWRDYCNKKSSQKSNFFPKPILKLALLLSVIIGLTIVFWKKDDVFKRNSNPEVEFKIDKFDSTEVPSVAIFKYKVNAKRYKNVKIYPTGGEFDAINVNVNDSIATYTYLRPWPYNPILIIDDKPVKRLKVNFVFDAWKAGLSNTRQKYYIKYFDDKEIFTNGTLSFSKALLEKYNFPLQQVEYVTYDFFKPFANIHGDSLYYITRVNNHVLAREEGSGNINVSLCFSKGLIIIPFRNDKTPYDSVELVLFEKHEKSTRTDLSFLYLNLEQWNTFEVITINKTIKIKINGELAYQSNYKREPGTLTGISFDFNGFGQVDYVKFLNTNGDTLYYEGFE